MVSPWGVLPFGCVRKRFSGFYRFYGFSGEGAAQKIWKRRKFYREGIRDQKGDWRFSHVVIPSEVEGSLWQAVNRRMHMSEKRSARKISRLRSK